MITNIICAAMYFSLVGIQWIHCSAGFVTCSTMISLIPIFLGVMDTVLIGGSGRDSIVVRLAAIAMSISSITVATVTFGPIVIKTSLLTGYQLFMLYISLGAIIISVIEILIVVTDLATQHQTDDSILEGLVRTYDRWDNSKSRLHFLAL
jgi:hypothetical protein